jgi:hypothetical protein
MGLVDFVCRFPETFKCSLRCCCAKQPEKDDTSVQLVVATAAVDPASVVFVYDDLTIVGPGSRANSEFGSNGSDNDAGGLDTMIVSFPDYYVASMSGTIFSKVRTGRAAGNTIDSVLSGSFLSVIKAALELLHNSNGATIQFNCVYCTKPITILIYAMFGKNKSVIGAAIVCRQTHYDSADLQKILSMGSAKHTAALALANVGGANVPVEADIPIRTSTTIV